MTKHSSVVLVVEDDFDTRFLLSVALQTAGYSVVTAGDGNEALRYLQSGASRPRVILLDLMMPVMNGWEFREAQQQDPEIAEIPVVILSASADVARQADVLHVATFLVKPLDLDALIEITGRYC